MDVAGRVVVGVVVAVVGLTLAAGWIQSAAALPDDPSALSTPPAEPTSTDPDPENSTEPAPTPTQSDEPAPSGSEESTAASTSQPASPTLTPTPSTPVPTPSESVLGPLGPTIGGGAAVPIGSVVIALCVLAAAGLLLARLVGSAVPVQRAAATPPPADTDTGTDVVVVLSALGQALIDSGFDVSDVQTTLSDIARAYGLVDAEIVALPTAVMVSARAGSGVGTRIVASGRSRLRLHQVEELDDVVTLARTGSLGPGEALARLIEIEGMPPPFRRRWQVLGLVLASAGLAVILGSSWLGLLVAAALAPLVAALVAVGDRVPPRFRVLLVVAASFLVALVVFLLTRTGLPIPVIPALMGPLITLLPGALLTTSVIELSTGQMIAGAGRLAAGGMQLVLLALGIVSAAALVGVDINTPDGAPLFGSIGPWLAVAVFGVGIVLSQNARPRTLGWILLVLYVAYGAQVVGGLFLGAVLSAFVGAAAMTPVADVIARQRHGTPAIVSFTPAFWLLVPGALGLVGVASLLHGDSGGTAALVTTTLTMVAIALGVLVGRALSVVLGQAGPDGRHQM